LYKLFIVDDESDVVDGITTTINWRKHGIEVCGCATNGLEALELIRVLLPDLLIVDVNMPVMDGITLLERLREEKIELEFLILSGYDEFGYAQRAINLGATDYLLKPCMPQDILTAVLKAKSIAEEQRSREKLLEHYRTRFQQNLPILKERLLLRLLEGKIKDQAGLNEEMDLYEISLPQSDLTVVLFKLDNTAPVTDRDRLINVETSKLAMLDIVKREFVSISFRAEVFICEEYITAICSPQSCRYTMEQFTCALDKIREQIAINLGLTVTIGVGNPVNSPQELWKCYSECRSAVDTKSFLGDNRVILFNDIVLEKANTPLYPFNKELDIINCLRTGNKEGILEKIDSFYNEISIVAKPSKEFLQKISIVFIGNIYRFCLEEKIDTQVIFAEQIKFFDDILYCETIIQLKEKICQLLCSIMDHMNEHENTNKLIEAAIEYIKSNYADDIRLETIAQKIYITPGYLSILFKQAVGINFVDYLHQFRIQMAKKHIKDCRFKLYEISSMVGYRDEKYFSQVFKRYTGLTPKQYRENLSQVFEL
jgi:two-component system response regulator YesN